MLRDKFFLWPYENESLAQAVAELTPILAKTPLNRFLGPVPPAVKMVTGGLAEFMALVCRSWNINPFWLIVCAQREQGMLEKLAGLAEGPVAAEIAWLGVVGQDVGRTTNPGYLGVYTQVERACEVTAWLLGPDLKAQNGKEPAYPSDRWPEYYRTRKQAARFRLGMTIPIVDKAGAQVSYTPQAAGEYAQLAFTPHLQVLDSNDKIALKFVPARRL